MTTTEHVKGRLWLLFPGCRIHAAADCPLDPATAIGHGHDGEEFQSGPPCSSPARPASRTARRGKSNGGGMFDGSNGGGS